MTTLRSSLRVRSRRAISRSTTSRFRSSSAALRRGAIAAEVEEARTRGRADHDVKYFASTVSRMSTTSLQRILVPTDLSDFATGALA